MSATIHQLLTVTAAAMVAEQASNPAVKLTYPALASRAGLSLSTVNRPEYRDIRASLKAAKPSQPKATTNEDAAEWRRRYYALLEEKSAFERVLRDELADQRATCFRLVQRLQGASLASTPAS